MLTCSCVEWDGEGWFYVQNGDFGTLDTSRRKRCCSCGKLIDIGAVTVEFRRYRAPITFVEENIYGEDGEVPLAPMFMCERCGEIFHNLDELGFCLDITESMEDALSEYQDMTGFKKAKNERD